MLEQIMSNLVISFLLFVAVASQDQDDLWKKPYIRFEPQDVTVLIGQRIELKCGVMGFPRPNVTWYKGDMPLISQGTRKISFDYTLSIEKARRTEYIDDSGKYYCEAWNKHGRFRSRNATVIVLFLNDKFKEHPKNATVSMSDSHVFQCVPPDGKPKPDVVWYHDGKQIKLTPPWVSSAVGENGKFQLVMKQVVWRFRGKYKCLGFSKVGKKWSDEAYLDIRLTKPSILMNDVDVYVGQSVNIQCGLLSEPKPIFSWSKVNDSMPDANRYTDKQNGEISIDKIQYEDAGLYKCTASNSAGSTSKTGELKVYPEMKFSIVPIGITRNVDQDAEFHCSVTGGISPKIHWIYQGTRYDDVGREMDAIHVTKDGVFVIKKVKLTSMGNVLCVASDKDKAKIEFKAKLTVIEGGGKLPTVTLDPPSITVPEGNPLELTCKATGGAGYIFEWNIANGNEIIRASTSVMRQKTTYNKSVLFLSKTAAADTAIYRCLVTSGGVTSYEMSNVTVLPIARKPSPVTKFRVTDIKATSVKLTWSIPSGSTLTPITSFKITVVNEKTSKETYVGVKGSRQTEKVVTGLAPLNVYKFIIIAINKIGPSDPTASKLVETVALITTVSPRNAGSDKLEDVVINLRVGVVTYNTIEVKWEPVDPSRITGYVISYKRSDESNFKPIRTNNPYAQSYTIPNLDQIKKYAVKVTAYNTFYESKEGGPVYVETMPKGLGASQMLIGLQKVDNENLLVHLTPPEEIKEANEIDSYEISCLYDDRSAFDVNNANKHARKYLISGLNAYKRYVIFVRLKTATGLTIKSKEYNLKLSTLKEGEVIGHYSADGDKSASDDSENGILKVIREPWFIATIGVLVWLLLLVCVILICCRRRRRKKHNPMFDGYKSSSGLLNSTREYPNTSLRRNERWNSGRDSETMLHSGRKRKGIGNCCRSQASSLDDEDFPNKVEIKPMMTYTRHESVEMRPPKSSNGDLSFMKENNLGVAMKNGYKVDAPLNNEISLRYPDYNSDSNRFYDSDERHHSRAPPRYDDLVAPQGIVNLPRDPRYKTDSVERRHAEIVRTATKKSFPNADLNNMLETTQQASWKREKPKNSPKLTPKPPGENTLRRQGKTQFKPLPKLESLDWVDGLPNSSKPPSSINGGSPAGSTKLSSAASVLSDGNDNRGDSRMSHGGSSNSLNKYSRRRKNSNASSMMSSELYQSEMDPSGYSDIYPSDKKKKKEKAVPPPIDLDGLTSDILLQWAESVTNSSPSSSGSSSPSRLSGISSEGSIYTDEDFAQAVAAVVECGGFNMDYDYSIPGMPAAQQPLSATRNSKMDKIDQVLAQRSKLRQTSTPNKPEDSSQVSGNAFVPQISMSNYLTGSHKPASLHSGSSGIPRSTRAKPPPTTNRRYGTGFDDIDSVSSCQLTKSNLIRHDTSLERDKKESAKPLTITNLRHHDTSLERTRKRAPQKPDNFDHVNSSEKGLSTPQLMPEAALSVTSALERNESMNSKDSMNSSSKQDSEVENLPSTSERKPKAKKNFVNISNSSTGTVRSGMEPDSRC